MAVSHSNHWSGRGDLNARPPAPKAGALPGCATPRLHSFYTTADSGRSVPGCASRIPDPNVRGAPNHRRPHEASVRRRGGEIEGDNPLAAVTVTEPVPVRRARRSALLVHGNCLKFLDRMSVSPRPIRRSEER